MVFILTSPEFKEIKVHIGNFDRALRLIDSFNYKVVEVMGIELRLVLKQNRLGRMS
ncbi:MAG TPA: hypothetical protein VF691_22850 [Cytophagaceae bacterium]